ncbi:MAG: hypothetical protein WC346_20315 [Methanogenium sp.]|jgi:hypothetical protein
MIICIDYDDTYTRDPSLWDSFISNAKHRNHTVICVTMRSEIEGKEVRRYLDGLVDDIYFTNREAKKPFLDKLNIFPHVWIDDQPLWIFYGAKEE